MALLPMNLRLEASDGSGEEYRVREEEIEVRSVTVAEADDNWRTLSSTDLADHVQRNTVVAEWLKHRIGWRRLLLKCADQEALQKFGVMQTTNDRFAA